MTAMPPPSSRSCTSLALLSACGSWPMLRRIPTEMTSVRIRGSAFRFTWLDLSDGSAHPQVAQVHDVVQPELQPVDGRLVDHAVGGRRDGHPEALVQHVI